VGAAPSLVIVAPCSPPCAGLAPPRTLNLRGGQCYSGVLAVPRSRTPSPRGVGAMTSKPKTETSGINVGDVERTEVPSRPALAACIGADACACVHGRVLARDFLTLLCACARGRARWDKPGCSLASPWPSLPVL